MKVALCVLILSLSATVQADKGRIQIRSLYPHKLDLSYHHPSKKGVRISSEIKEDAHLLKVHAFDDKPLISIHRKDESAVLLNIMGRQFLVLNESDTEHYMTGFAVPDHLSRRLERIFYKKKLNSKVLQFLDFDGANESRSAAVQDLLDRDELAMIREAAETLGRQGVTGVDNPAILPLYVLAMRLQHIKNDAYSNKDREHEQLLESELEEKDLLLRERRNHCSGSQTHCSNTGRCCNRCPGEDRCLGLCGSGCTCWPWTCGTCCYHGSCADHDRCCRTNPQSWGCLVPLGFSCRRNRYTCYSDRTFHWFG